MTTAELMAVAVLKGDMTAARALADEIMDNYQGELVKPVRKAVYEEGTYRYIAYIANDNNIEPLAFRTTMENWIQEGGVLMLRGVERFEIYDLNI